MIIRQVRLMIALTDENENPIDEVKRMAPWQKDKLRKQAALFSPNELKELYNRLFEIEIGQKTGQLPNTILTSIDFLLLEI